MGSFLAAVRLPSAKSLSNRREILVEERSFKNAVLSRKESVVPLLRKIRFHADKPGVGMTRFEFFPQASLILLCDHHRQDHARHLRRVIAQLDVERLIFKRWDIQSHVDKAVGNRDGIAEISVGTYRIE
jgi:hypothetical protein